MSRGNFILLGVLAGAAGLWLAGHDWDKDKPAGPVPRLFPTFNKEGADGIAISGGWQGTSWELKLTDAGWVVASAGGYPVKKDEVANFLDAVLNLRKDYVAGTSAAVQASTHTDDKNGRLVRVLRQNEPMAEFYVGKNPKSGYQHFFVRKAGDDTVYRTRTLLTKDREREIRTESEDDPFVSRPSGFNWDSYTDRLATKWVDRQIWDLGGAEAQEISLTRRGSYEVTIRKEAQDKWQLVEKGKESEPVAADADACDGIVDAVRRLTLDDLVGTYEQVAEEHGLHEPEITLVLTLRKKVEKKEEEKKEGEAAEPKEGQPKPEEKKEAEYVTLTRVVQVGNKVTRPRYESYSDEMKSDEFCAIHVMGTDQPEEEAKRSDYVFLVQYTADRLRKDLSDLKAKPKEEEEKGPGEGEEAEKPAGEEPTGEPAEEKPAEEEGAEEKPADEKPAGGEGGAEGGGCGEEHAGCGDQDPGSGERGCG